MSKVVSHPSSTIYDGTDFAKPKTFICHPLDQTDYLKYGGWHGTDTLDEFWSHIAIWPGHNPDSRPMSTIFVVIEQPAVQNAYELKARARYYTRWPLDSVGGQAQGVVPTASANVVNAARDRAEATAHIPREGAVAAAGAAVMGGLGWVARGARAGAAAIEGAGALMEPLLPMAAML